MRQLVSSNKRLSWYVILAALVVMVLLFAIPSQCQSTTVSATVVDQASTVWANGTWKLDFIPNPNYQTNNVQWNGNPFPNTQWHFAGSLNNSGVFSQSTVPSNNFITPSGSTYTLTVCPNATSPCSVIKNLTVSGASIDFSSTVTGQTPAPSVLPLPLARAYNDAEVSINPSLAGYFYMRVSDNQPRFWGQDGAWHNFVTGLVSFSAGNLDPLFTTFAGVDPQNPSLTFTKESVGPQLVYANCTGAGATPLFCAITAGMLPAILTSSTTGSAGSLAGTPFNCTGNLFSKGITNVGNSNCAQPAFTNLTGNINVSQMNSGTNADASHVFVGGNSGAGSWVLPSSLFTKTVVASVNFTSCSLVHIGDTDQNCAATKSWGTTITGTYSISCIIGVPGFTGGGDSTGLTQTTWGLSGSSPFGSTSFSYYIANQHDSAAGNTVTMSCIAVQ